MAILCRVQNYNESLSYQQKRRKHHDKWEFDITVGQNKEILKISEILKLADGCTQRGEHQAARILYARASASDDLSALQRQPVTVLEEDSHGAYVLAAELGYYEGNVIRQWERCLLQAAVEYGNGTYAGIAAQCLAEIYSEKNLELTDRYRILACKLGNSEILSRC